MPIWGDLNNQGGGGPLWMAALARQETRLGHATFDCVNHRLVDASGDAWRYLFDLIEDNEGRPATLPWETYGALPAPKLLRAGE